MELGRRGIPSRSRQSIFRKQPSKPLWNRLSKSWRCLSFFLVPPPRNQKRKSGLVVSTVGRDLLPGV
jgi:hypothetical protein